MLIFEVNGLVFEAGDKFAIFWKNIQSRGMRVVPTDQDTPLDSWNVK